MNQELTDIRKKVIDKIRGLRFDRRLLVFLFFIVLSSLFWFLGALNKEYTTRMSYPVRYTNLPGDKLLVNELPDDFDLTINAHGYTILRYYLSRRLLPIVIDVNSFSRGSMPEDTTSDFYILSSVARSRISGQLGTDIEVVDILPDTIFFSFTDLIVKKLPVNANMDLTFERQFMIRGEIEIVPDSVLVSGPASVIDTMLYVYTEKVEVRNLKDNFIGSVPLSSYNVLSFENRNVEITVPVEQYTEASVRIDIEKLGLPDTLIMKTFPSIATISFLVPLVDYDRIDPYLFSVAADFNEVVAGNERIPLKLIRQPDFVRSVRFSPRNVDYIIER